MTSEFGVIVYTGLSVDDMDIKVESFYGLEEAQAYARMNMTLYPRGSYRIFYTSTGVLVEEG